MKYSIYKNIKRFIERRIFKLFFSRKFKLFGKKVFIQSPDIIEGEEFISLENYVSIGSFCWLLAHKKDNFNPNFYISENVTIGRLSHIVCIRQVLIEKNVLIADKVYISDNMHSYESLEQPIQNQPVVFKKEVVIGENSWIGENVSIIGAKIGKNCVVGSNSVVTKDILDFSVVAGIPAEYIKRYNFKTRKWERTKSNGEFLQ